MSVCHHIDPRFRSWTDDMPIEERRLQRLAWDAAHARAMNAVAALFPDRRRYSNRWTVVHTMGWVQAHSPSDEQIRDMAAAMLSGEIFQTLTASGRQLCAWSIAVFYRYVVDGVPRRAVKQ